MLQLEIDVLKNRLFITIGTLHQDELDQVAPFVLGGLEKIRPDFTVIVDIRKAKLKQQYEFSELIKIQSLIFRAKVGVYIRITNTGSGKLRDKAHAAEKISGITETVEVYTRTAALQYLEENNL